jgi:hypothetical protein
VVPDNVYAGGYGYKKPVIRTREIIAGIQHAAGSITTKFPCKASEEKCNPKKVKLFIEEYYFFFAAVFFAAAFFTGFFAAAFFAAAMSFPPPTGKGYIFSQSVN